MLGSHNSYTHLKAVNKDIFNKFTKYWRCQYKTIQEQYAVGVRFFDVRVREEHKKVGGKDRIMWRSCHGAVDLDNLFTSLSVLCKYFQGMGPDVKIRLILEKGDETAFRKEVEDKVIPKFKSVVLQVAIKSGWKVLYSDWQGISLTDYCYIPWDTGKGFWYNVTHFTGSTIKKWAKEHNPVVTKEMIEDPKHIYFMDCI